MEHHLDLTGGLIDNGPPVDHVDQAPREYTPLSSVMGQRHDPNRDAGRLAEPSWDVARSGQAAVNEALEQRPLPGERRVACERLEEGIKARPWGCHRIDRGELSVSWLEQVIEVSYDHRVATR
jgi:hypothetical protein